MSRGFREVPAVKSDPFAPATSPTHIKNLRATEADEPTEERELADEERDILLETHVTEREKQADLVPDDEELTRRETLVSEFFDELREHDEAENPTLVDLTEAEHVWYQHDEGTYRHQLAEGAEPEPYGWVAVEDLAVEDSTPPEEEQAGPKADDAPAPADKKPAKRSGRKGKQQPENLDDALAALDEDK